MTAPLPPHHFLTATTALTGADAVAALLVLDDGRYLMQLRDDIPEMALRRFKWNCRAVLWPRWLRAGSIGIDLMASGFRTGNAL